MIVAAFQAVQRDPFFTDDGVGVLRLLGFSLFILAPMLGVVYKLSFNKTNDDLARTKDDVNGLGERVDAVELAQRATEATVGTLKESLARYEGALGSMQRDYGTLTANVEQLRQQAQGMQHDILETIIEGNRQVNESITTVRLEVAKIQTAQDVVETIGQKLADAIRAQPRQGNG